MVKPHSCFRQHVVATLLVLLVALVSSAFAQQPVLTSRDDNARSDANTNEMILTPANVNSTSFGHLFSSPVDYEVLAQPLYVPNVTINTGPYQGTVHNVVYVVTQADSVYAFDADNGTQLWYASMLQPAGSEPASGKYIPCGIQDGFTEEGIVGTPVIDLTTTPPTMYLVAKTLLAGVVYHYLHALDITTGLDQVSQVEITATSYSIAGKEWKFDNLHQKNRPGALLLNGILYLGFGSNGCNDGNSGWVLAYNTVNYQQAGLQQVGVFNTSPDIGLTSVWQTGNGLAADAAGNIYFSTAESHIYGGQSYSNSVLKLPPAPWPAQSPSQPQQELPDANFFTPWEVAYLNSHDLDVSSVGPVILPDQENGPPNCPENPCQEVIASGKSMEVYVLDRNNMGAYAPGGPNDPQIPQEFMLESGSLLMSSPAYWNGLVYFGPEDAPIQSFQLSNGVFTPFAQSADNLAGAHAPTISANGTTNGILWHPYKDSLQALDAVSLKVLYTSSKMPTLAHFATPMVANGKVYMATGSTLEAYGLVPTLSVVGGNNQTAPVLTALPAPLQVVASNPYSGQAIAGVTVSFSDGNRGGSFNPPSAVTNSNGAVSTIYTFPSVSGPYTLTISAPNFVNVTAAETATPGAAARLLISSGSKQSGAEGTVLPNPLVVKALDAYKNLVPGVTVNFTPGSQGVTNPASAVTDAKGQASTYFQLPQATGSFTVVASSSGVKSVTFHETSVADPRSSRLRMESVH